MASNNNYAYYYEDYQQQQQQQQQQQPDMREYNAYYYSQQQQQQHPYNPQYYPQQVYPHQQAPSASPPSASSSPRAPAPDHYYERQQQQQQQPPLYPYNSARDHPKPPPPAAAAASYNIFAPAAAAANVADPLAAPLKTLLTPTAKQPYQMLADYSPGDGGGSKGGGGGAGGGGPRSSTDNLLNNNKTTTGSLDAKVGATTRGGRRGRRGGCCGGRYCGCCMACVPRTRRGKVACAAMILILIAGLAVAAFFLFPRMPDITVKSFRIDAASGDAASAATISLPSKANNNTLKLALPVVMKVEAMSINPYKIRVANLNVSAFVNTIDDPRQPIGTGGERNVMIAAKGLTQFTLNFTIEYSQKMGLIGVLTDPGLNQFLASCNISAFSSTAVQGQPTKIDYSTDVTVFPLSNLGIVPNLAGSFGFPCPFGGAFLKGVQDVAAGLKNGTVGTAALSKKVKTLLAQTALGSSLLKDFDLDGILKSAGL
ncbi:hypothetical protein HDU86_004149 [Geranomyces michiganensis]|nr:hypothetical protein HDU86_004149 [Geranomyces michiganensis]